jgi:superkiller protein 3
MASVFVLIFFICSQATPTLPTISFERFGPGIRQQVGKAVAAARNHPHDAHAAGYLGMVLHTYEDHESAVACYRVARALAPNEFRWAYLQGVAFSSLGKQREAIASFRSALKIQADSIPAQLKLAEALATAGEWAESQAWFESLKTKTRDWPQVYYGLGRISAAQRNMSSAIQAFQKAIEIFPEYGAAHYALGLAFRDAGDNQTASRHFALAQTYKTSRPILPILMDTLMAEVSDLNQGATECIRKGIELEAAGRLEESITEHLRALEINPQLAQAHINLIQLYGRTQNPARAQEHFRSAVAINPNLAESHYNYGVMLAAQQKLREASAAFRRAIEINPQFADAQLNYGVSLEAQQQYDLALEHYRLAVIHKTNHRQARFQLARMLIYKGQFPEAIEQLQQTILPVDEQAPRYTYALGAAYARVNDLANAVKYLRLARDRAQKFGQTDLLAQIERDLGILERTK